MINIFKFTFSIVILLFIAIKPNYAFSDIPEVGSFAPDFNLSGINSNMRKTNFTNNDFAGKWIVLYFYPKDFTTGCTIEAKGFSNLRNDFKKLNAEIVGISADSKESHDSFCSSKEIKYTLLSDPNGEVSDKYGSWIPPYSDRNTFLVDPNGKIRKIWLSVSPLNHPKEVYKTLLKLY